MRSSTKYVIVGGGSAGCTLARRILEFDSKATVKLIETGQKDRNRWDSWTIRMPSALTYNVADKRYNYDYYTVPQKHLNNRSVHEPRGKVLGGSSNINAMVYIRGNALDYERWAKDEGAGEEWSYANVLPYFKRAQRHVLGESKYRGGSGLLDVKSYSTESVTNELFNAFVEAGVQAGYPRNDDVNGKSQYGFGPFDMTISPNGVRCSASVAYLHSMPPELSNRLEILTGKTVTRVRFEGKRAIGVELNDGSFVEASKEVILCAGAVGSPTLLMLSGVGPKTHLHEVDIKDIVLDSPHVGSNLQDHLEVYLQYKCKLPVTLFPVGNWTLRYLHRRLKVGLDWFLFGTGIAASNQFEMGAFVFTDKTRVKHPDIQYHFIPGAVLGQLEFLPYHAFQIHVGTLRPTSRGTIRLQSNKWQDAPLIDPNFLATERDMEDMRIATRLAHQIIEQPAFKPYLDGFIRGEEVLQGDEQLDTWIRESSHSAYHLSCTCAMGKVVDSHGLVLGLENLRVVDASIMPSMTSGNLNAPTIMIAEKIADHICGRKPLPPAQL